MKYQILTGDNRDTLKTIADNSIDAIVTDPPYGIDFLGKAWDANTGALETYQECLRVLKPGGHILAFSAARTYHHLATTLEQAGFEIRDQIMWIYSSGFPKSQDVGKSIERSEGKRKKTRRVLDIRPEYSQGVKGYCIDCNKSLNGKNDKKCQREDCGFKEHNKPAQNEWAGWGTQLKPAHEPICMARKPIKLGSIQKNVQQWGTGALNIDATRIPSEPRMVLTPKKGTYQCVSNEHSKNITTAENSEWKEYGDRFPSNVIGEITEPYQKYFYCPKVSRKERHIGCIDPGPMFERPRDENGKPVGEGESMWMDPKVSGPKKIAEQPAGTNNHPTVKPVELMKYLIKLVTPPNGIVLDPFNGSGSTGMAAVELGHEYIGCELDPNYVEIAKRRIEAWNKTDTNFQELFE